MSSSPTTTTPATPTNNLYRHEEGIAKEFGNVIQKRKTLAQQGGAAAADMTRRMICGGLAGMVAKTATNPLERIKMLSQTGEHGGKSNVSVVELYKSIIRNEGVIGLWAGNGANLVRIFPAKAVVFSTNDMYQSMFRKLLQTPYDQKLPSMYAFIAGGFAGMTATACTYPLDFARGRISGKLATSANQKEYKGIIRTVLITGKDEGFLALYKGVTPTLIGAIPYEGIKFGTVGFLEHYFPQEGQQQQMSTPIRKMIFGGLGGVMAGLITYPNDTVRRLLQLQGSRGSKTNYTGYWDCVRQTLANDGITRFYRGVTINIIRMAPNAAVQFGSYEVLKNITKGYF